jgi:hypothetical protein
MAEKTAVIDQDELGCAAVPIDEVMDLGAPAAPEAPDQPDGLPRLRVTYQSR